MPRDAGGPPRDPADGHGMSRRQRQQTRGSGVDVGFFDSVPRDSEALHQAAQCTGP